MKSSSMHASPEMTEPSPLPESAGAHHLAPENISSRKHVGEDDLEAFAMERLAPEHAQRVVHHLLDCRPCFLRLIREAILIETIRESLRTSDKMPTQVTAAGA